MKDKCKIAYSILCKRVNGKILVGTNDGFIDIKTKRGWMTTFITMENAKKRKNAHSFEVNDDEKIDIVKKILDTACERDVFAVPTTKMPCLMLVSKGETLEALLIENDLNAS